MIKTLKEDSSEEVDRLFFKRHYLTRKNQLISFLEYWKHFAFNSFLGKFFRTGCLGLQQTSYVDQSRNSV